MAKKKVAKGTTKKATSLKTREGAEGDNAAEEVSGTELSGADFEEAMEKLEEIVQRLESGGGTLDSALDDYADAIKLVKLCHRKLETAERRIEILSGVDADGNPIKTPFQNSDGSLEEKRQMRSSRRSAQGGDPEGTSEEDSTLF